MLRVLVLTVVTVVLADAGYQYNAPSGSINQPAPFTIGHSPTFHSRPLTDDHDKPLSHSVSYKDYIYLNKDVERLPSNVKTEAPLSIQPVAGTVLNNGYTQTLAPSSNSPINSGYSYNLPIVSGNTNSIVQSSTSSGVNLNAGYSQSFTPPITVSAAGSGFNSNAFVNLNNGFAQSYAPMQNVYLNSGYSNGLSQSSSISTGFTSGNVHTSSLAANSNLNNGYSYNQPQSSGIGFASSNAQSSSLSASSNFNSGFSQSLPLYNGNSFASSNSQTASVSASSNLNTGFSQSLLQTNGNGVETGSSNLNSGYSYSSPQNGGNGFASGNSQISSQGAGFSSSFVQPVSNSHFSNGYSNGIASSGSSSFSNAYNTIPSGTSNLNSGVAQSVQSSSSDSFNNGYVQSSGFANPPTSSASTNVAQSSSGTTNTGFVQSLSGSNNLNTAFSQQGSANQAIFKHIYFHAPPPGIEDQRFGKPAPPVKKNYKIIFIKVPSQDSKSNLARLQLAQSPNGVGAVEHKTLIYVLVKNPDTQRIIPKKVPSEHEVFFVKYNGNPLNFAARVNEEIDKTGSVQSVVPLEPGLVNGHTF